MLPATHMTGIHFPWRKMHFKLRSRENKPERHALWIKITYFTEVHDGLRDVWGPGVGAFGTNVPGFPVFVHNWLQNGSKRCYADASADENCVLGAENVTRRCSVRPIDVNLKKSIIWIIISRLNCEKQLL